LGAGPRASREPGGSQNKDSLSEDISPPGSATRNTLLSSCFTFLISSPTSSVRVTMASSQDLPTYVSTLLTSFTSRIANQTSLYSTLTLPLPLAPIHPLSALLEHITSKPVHEVYFPFLRFGAIHAVRTTTMWAAMTRGKDRGGVSRLQDLFGYLTLACTRNL